MLVTLLPMPVATVEKVVLSALVPVARVAIEVLTPVLMVLTLVVMAVLAASAAIARSWKEASDSVTMLAKIADTSESVPLKASINACLEAAPASPELVSADEAASSSALPHPNKDANQPPTLLAALFTPSQVSDAQEATSPTALETVVPTLEKVVLNQSVTPEKAL